MMPDPKIGEVMISSSKEIVKSILKNFKNMGSAIKKWSFLADFLIPIQMSISAVPWRGGQERWIIQFC